MSESQGLWCRTGCGSGRGTVGKQSWSGSEPVSVVARRAIGAALGLTNFGPAFTRTALQPTMALARGATRPRHARRPKDSPTGRPFSFSFFANDSSTSSNSAHRLHIQPRIQHVISRNTPRRRPRRRLRRQGRIYAPWRCAARRWSSAVHGANLPAGRGGFGGGAASFGPPDQVYGMRASATRFGAAADSFYQRWANSCTTSRASFSASR